MFRCSEYDRQCSLIVRWRIDGHQFVKKLFWIEEFSGKWRRDQENQRKCGEGKRAESTAVPKTH